MLNVFEFKYFLYFVFHLWRFTLVGLKELCMWFDLERGGTKEKMCERILEFLLKPEPSGRPLPEKSKYELL